MPSVVDLAMGTAGEFVMHVNGRRLTGASLWFAATGFLLLSEVQMMCHRTSPVTPVVASQSRSTQKREPLTGRAVRSEEVVRLGGFGQKHTSAILVVGCAGTASDGEFDVTLSVRRADTRGPFGGDFRGIVDARVSTADDFDTRPDRTSNMRRLTTPSGIPSGRAARPMSPLCDVTRRVFFIHSRRGALDDPASYSAIDCRLVGESDSIRVYAEQTVPDDEPLDSLVAELNQLADKTIGPTIQALVGPVRDVDDDGKLAVVLTSQLGQVNGTLGNVDGLTRASDFRRQVLRPIGNEADVIFLSAKLPRGERLRAVLAHEWAHAAIFGRRYGGSGGDAEQVPAEDDWLNEALAHLIEVRASGSSSNISHRIQAFLDRPENSPLVVRDYYRPEFWRHHGCRGATFLFLDWSLLQSGPQSFDHLIEGPSVGVEHLEHATERSFETLFRSWTTSLGENLAQYEGAGNEAGCGATARDQSVRSRRPRLHEWKPREVQSPDKTVRLRGTTATYIKVVLGDAAANWRVVADAPPECRLQLTAIPIEGAR